MDTNEAFAILSDSDRQHVLEELLETEGRTTVGVLADQLAARRKNRADELDRERAEVHLVHNHLPHLADHGVIEYDRESGEVVLVDASDLEPYLTDPVRKRRIPIDE